MNIEVVTREGWFSRLRNAIGGVLVGLVLLTGAAILQFWNEGRTLTQAQLLDDGQTHTSSASRERVDAAKDNQLVHVQGTAAADGVLTDPIFDQSAEALALRRQVEMYQWKERREKKEETNLGGEKVSRTTYRYEKTWSDDLIDSSDFRETSGHQNPDRKPFESATWRADVVRMGPYTLAPDVASEIGGWKPMAPMIERLPENLAASFRADGELITTSSSGTPRVGDVRIRFERIPGGVVTVVAEQRGASLVVAQRKLGSLVLVERGELSLTQIFDEARSRNAMLAWVLRLVGFVLMWVGFSLVFAPFSVAADVLPIFGGLSRFAFGIVSGVLAAFFSFVAIASGWLFHRPWLLVLMIAACIVGVPWLFKKLRGSGSGTGAGAAAPPPAPVSPPPPPPA